MNPYVETAGVVLLALLGAAGGRLASRLRNPWWMVGYVPPLGLVIMVALARRFDALTFVPPFCWVMAGRTEFALMAAGLTMLVVTPFSRRRRRTEKALAGVLGALAVMHFSVMPFLMPALVRGELAALKTIVDGDGVCVQNNHYTCGPAAAVTALRRLGIRAEEGELAVLSHTNPISGTPSDSLCIALQKLYGQDGLVCEYRHFKTISELRDAGVTIAVVKYKFLVDHYVTVLEVNDRRVVYGDPLTGRKMLSHEEFRDKWRSCGIALKRLPAGEADVP